MYYAHMHESRVGLLLVLKATPGETFAEASLFHRNYHCSAVVLSE